MNIPSINSLLVLLLIIVIIIPWADAYAPHFIRRFRQVWQYPLVGGRPIWPRGFADLPGTGTPKLDGGRGSKPSEGNMPRTRTSRLSMLTRSVPAAGLGTARGFSGLTRRLARQEARNAECGPSSSAAARLWMPNVEKLGRARPGSTVEESRRLRLGSRGVLAVGRGDGCDVDVSVRCCLNIRGTCVVVAILSPFDGYAKRSPPLLWQLWLLRSARSRDGADGKCREGGGVISVQSKVSSPTRHSLNQNPSNATQAWQSWPNSLACRGGTGVPQHILVLQRLAAVGSDTGSA